MKRRHLITIEAPKDRQYRYMVVFTDTVADVGMAFYANTEDEAIEYVRSEGEAYTSEISQS